MGSKTETMKVSILLITTVVILLGLTGASSVGEESVGQRVVRGLSNSNSNSNNNEAKKKRSGKKKKRSFKCSRQSREGITDECLQQALKYQAAVSGFVTNLARQYNRIKSQNKTGSGKADKKGLFKPLISKLIKAGGGNASDLSCAGSKVGDGAKNIKNLTDEIKACEANIVKACDPKNFPKPNTTYIEKCITDGEAFVNATKECKGKKGEEACACFTNSTLNATFVALKTCNFANDTKKVKDAFKECKKSFGACRKLEDKVVGTIVSCGETPDKLKQEAKALSDNNDATKAAQAKIKADLTKYISESPS